MLYIRVMGIAISNKLRARALFAALEKPQSRFAALAKCVLVARNLFYTKAGGLQNSVALI